MKLLLIISLLGAMAHADKFDTLTSETWAIGQKVFSSKSEVILSQTGSAHHS